MVNFNSHLLIAVLLTFNIIQQVKYRKYEAICTDKEEETGENKNQMHGKYLFLVLIMQYGKLFFGVPVGLISMHERKI